MAKAKKNRNSGLAEKVQNKKKNEAQKKKLNPFEVHINREKIKVLGKKSKSDRGLPGVARAKAIQKRKETLGTELKLMNKTNTFIDRRIGEKDGQLSNEDRIIARFAAERAKQHSKKDMFNLADDEVLTHRGQTLEQIEKFDDPRSSDDEDDDGRKKFGGLGDNFVAEGHFGGGVLSRTDAKDGAKSHKDLIEQLIAESKKRKFEKQKEKEQTLDLTEKLDTEWKDLQPVVLKKSRVEESIIDKLLNKADRTNADYDKMMKELRFEKRGTPSDGLQSEEKKSKEEQKKLELMERERKERMLADEVAVSIRPAVSTHRSAEDLDDNLELDTGPDYMLAYDKDGKPLVPDHILKANSVPNSKKQFDDGISDSSSGEDEDDDDDSDDDNGDDSKDKEESNNDKNKATSLKSKSDTNIEDQESDENDSHSDEDDGESDEIDSKITPLKEKEPVVLANKKQESKAKVKKAKEIVSSKDNDEIVTKRTSVKKIVLVEKTNEKPEIKAVVKKAEQKIDVVSIQDDKKVLAAKTKDNKTKPKEVNGLFSNSDDIEQESDDDEESGDENEESIDESSKRDEIDLNNLDDLMGSDSSSDEDGDEKSDEGDEKSGEDDEKSDESDTSEEDSEKITSFFEKSAEGDNLKELLSGKSPQQVDATLSKLIKSYDPGLNENNKDLLSKLFAHLLQYINDLFTNLKVESEIMKSFLIFSKIIPHLYDLAHTNKVSSKKFIAEVIKEKHDAFRKNTKKVPDLDTLVFFKLISLIYPTSDFRHPLTTPSCIFMSEILHLSRFRDAYSISRGLFIVALLVEYTVLSKRFVPAAINFLRGILYLTANTSILNPIQVVPPFRLHKDAKILNLERDCSKMAAEMKMLTKDLVANEIDDGFKIRSIYTSVGMLREFFENSHDIEAQECIFESHIQLLGRIDVDLYPKKVAACIEDTLKYMRQIIEVKTYTPLCREKKRPKALRLYEPDVQEVFTGGKNWKQSREKLEQDKLKHKYKKEMKGALREIRRDKAYIASVKLRQKIQSDNVRKQKVKEIYKDAAIQQGELNKLNKVK